MGVVVVAYTIQVWKQNLRGRKRERERESQFLPTTKSVTLGISFITMLILLWYENTKTLDMLKLENLYNYVAETPTWKN